MNLPNTEDSMAAPANSVCFLISQPNLFLMYRNDTALSP